MKTELHAWNQLRDKAAAQLHPQFAHNVLRVARTTSEVVPSLLSYVTLSAATLVVCFFALTYVNHVSVSQDQARQASDWQQVISVDEDSLSMQ